MQPQQNCVHHLKQMHAYLFFKKTYKNYDNWLWLATVIMLYTGLPGARSEISGPNFY